MKKNNKRGFTLAELLIVVAIIGVLTAIAIPVFTTQLEKSREATDLSNIRAAYAEIAAEALTDPDVAKEITVALKQTQSNWQTTGANVAGIEIASDTWSVAKDGSVTVSYDGGVSGKITINDVLVPGNNIVVHS